MSLFPLHEHKAKSPFRRHETLLTQPLRKTADKALCLAMAVLAFVCSASLSQAQNIEVIKTPKGITALLISEPTVPILTMNFVFRSGANLDPEGKEGTAQLLSAMLDEGAGPYDAEAFQLRVRELSMGASFAAGRDGFTGSLRTLTAFQTEAFEMLRLALNEPHFESEPLERMRDQALVGARGRLADPGAQATAKLGAMLYRGHPYGRSYLGTLESIPQITREDLIDAKDRIFTRDHLRVAVVGDISPLALAPLLDQAFGDLPETAERTPVEDRKPRLGGRAAIEFNAPQTLIRFAAEGLKVGDPDFLASIALNHILGGGFTSRLNMELREKRGLVYSIGSNMSPFDHSALFAGGTATANNNAVEALQLIRSELSLIAEEGPTAEELEAAKSYLTGSYALRFDTSASVASQLMSILLYDLGLDYFQRRNELVKTLTLDDVKRAAKRTLGAQPMTYIVVGPGAERVLATLDGL